MDCPPELSIVVPVFHNEMNLPDLIPALERACAGIEVEFVLVDDGSRDGSWTWLERWAAREPRATAVKLSRNFGSFTACTAGLSYARGLAAMIISADLQDPPELIPEMVARWRAGHDVVLAVRNRRIEPWHQRLLAGVYYRLMRRWALRDMPPGGFDFCLIDRKVIDTVDPDRRAEHLAHGPRAVDGLSPRRGSLHAPRPREGPQHVDALEEAQVLRRLSGRLLLRPDPIDAGGGRADRVPRVRLGDPDRRAAIRGDIAIEGWSALMMVVLVLGGLQLLTLGVLGEYLWRTLDEAKRRPLYLVDRVLRGGEFDRRGRPEAAPGDRLFCIPIRDGSRRSRGSRRAPPPISSTLEAGRGALVPSERADVLAAVDPAEQVSRPVPSRRIDGVDHQDATGRGHPPGLAEAFQHAASGR